MQINSVNDTNSSIANLQQQQQELTTQKEQYIAEYKKQGGSTEDLDDDPYFISLEHQSQALELALNSQKAINTSSDGSNIKNMTTQKGELEAQLAELKARENELKTQKNEYIKKSKKSNTENDSFLMSLNFQQQALGSQQSTIQAQIDLIDESTAGNYPPEVQEKIEGITRKRLEIMKKSNEYASAYSQASNTGSLSNDAYLLELQREDFFWASELKKLKTKYNKKTSNTNKESKLETLQTQRTELLNQASAYAEAYYKAGGTGNLKEDPYLTALIYKDQALALELQNLLGETPIGTSQTSTIEQLLDSIQSLNEKNAK